MSEQPLLTYSDVSLTRRQTLTLWRDRVEVAGSVLLGYDYQAAFPLKSISPYVQRVAMRDRLFGTFLSLGVIGTLVAAVCYQFPGFNLDTTLGQLLLLLPLVSLIVCGCTFKKVAFTQFLSPQGTLLFGVVKGGKERERYEEVVARLVEEIKRAGGSEGEG
jgi:hypothetical protein